MKEKALAIVEALKEAYPDPMCALQYEHDYQLLIAVRLAAQCTDERVNQITPALYERFPTLEALAAADVAEVERYVHSTGFFRYCLPVSKSEIQKIVLFPFQIWTNLPLHNCPDQHI